MKKKARRDTSKEQRMKDNGRMKRVRVGGKNIKSPPELSLEQGLNGGWEFAKLSFPC